VRFVVRDLSPAILKLSAVESRREKMADELNRIRQAAAGDEVVVGGRLLPWRLTGAREDVRRSLSFL
jgi:hypothetical protein